MTDNWYSALVERAGAPSFDSAGLHSGGAASSPGVWESLQRRLQVADYRPQPDPAVVARELKDRRAPYFVLKNTREKTYLRLSAAEYDLWSRMDGKTSVQELVVEHFMVTGAFAHNTIVRLVDLLLQHHMLPIGRSRCGASCARNCTGVPGFIASARPPRPCSRGVSTSRAWIAW